MGNSQVVNGHDYIYVPIQVVSSSDTQYVLRAVVYVISYNVVDSVNNLSVSGNWSRSGALALNGTYNVTPVWYQDITVNRVYGSSQTVSVSVSWSGVEYWGQTLNASESYVVPARPPGVPAAPGTPSLGTVGPTTVALSWSPSGDLAGGSLAGYSLEVSTSPTFASGVLTFNPGTATSYTVTGLTPGTTYYARVKVSNGSYWSSPSGSRQFTTLSGGKIYTGGAWVDKVGKVRAAGAWAIPVVQKRSGGVWVP